jgi:Sec-independent protein translocase protein TatA
MEGFSFSEIILIIIIAIIIYGKDLPQAARKMATLYSKFKRQLADVREEIQRQIPMDEIQDSLKMDLPSGPGGEPPSTPSSLMASPTESNVMLTWNSSIGASSYTIRRSTGPQEPWLICAMNIAELAWTDTDVQPGKTYHYTVSGVNGTGESGNSDEVTAVIPGGEPAPSLPTPELPAATAIPAPEKIAPAPAVESASPTPAVDPSHGPSAPTAAPTNGNGDYPKEPPIPEEKGSAAPGAKPS